MPDVEPAQGLDVPARRIAEFIDVVPEAARQFRFGLGSGSPVRIQVSRASVYQSKTVRTGRLLDSEPVRPAVSALQDTELAEVGRPAVPGIVHSAVLDPDGPQTAGIGALENAASQYAATATLHTEARTRSTSRSARSKNPYSSARLKGRLTGACSLFWGWRGG